MLAQTRTSPDINNYLVYICITPTPPSEVTPDAYHVARSAAAIMLKNNVKNSFKSIPESSREYLKANVLLGLQDTNAQIRSYVGNVTTEVVRQGGVLGWPQVLPDLVAMVEGQNGQSSPESRDGAMGAIFKICEDNRKSLDKEYQTQRPLAFLLPKLVEFTRNNDAKVRSKALAAINVFLKEPVALSIRENIDSILPEIVRLSSDGDDNVRRFVCRAFALLAVGLPEILLPHVQGIIEYTLTQQKDGENSDLALDAAEFIFEASGSNNKLRDALGPHLPQIVPVLLDCMIYDEDARLQFEDDVQDAEVEDDEQDIKPQFATAKKSRVDVSVPGSSQTAGNGEAQGAANGYAFEDDDDLSEGEIEDEDYEVDPEEEWNLRKCSAATLDGLACYFHGAVFKEVLPWLVKSLEDSNWYNYEAAVLALGAIGPGCMDDVTPHLPELVPYMLNRLMDEHAIVRQVTCWSLSRYSGWAAHDPAASKQQFFEPMMEGLLKCMLDNNKKVQEAAASAFANLEEQATSALVPYCNVIIQQFMKCFQKYKDKNIHLLYACVQTLAEHAASSLSQSENVDILMPTLIERWAKVQDQSREMFPLLECLSFVATALGPRFAPFAPPLFARCIKILHTNLEDGMAAETEEYLESPDKDFLVTSLDLLSSIVQALDSAQSAELTATAQPNMFELLAYCMKDSSNDVKQSAYALLGDCAIYIFPQLQQYLPAMMTLITSQLDLSHAMEEPETAFRVINNACWSCGEISMRQKEGMSPYADRLLSKLAFIMFTDSVPESLTENAAIALGRLGLGCHQQLAPHLANFAGPFLQAMQKVEWNDEKGHAYKGFVKIVLDNPQALEKYLLNFFGEMANAPESFLLGMQDDGPRQGFEQILSQYKQMIGDGFEGFLLLLPAEQLQNLRRLYSF
jgi:hypothetical protein